MGERLVVRASRVVVAEVPERLSAPLVVRAGDTVDGREQDEPREPPQDCLEGGRRVELEPRRRRRRG